MVPQAAGGRLYSDTMGRLTFVLFLIYSLPVGMHHLFTGPGGGHHGGPAAHVAGLAEPPGTPVAHRAVRGSSCPPERRITASNSERPKIFEEGALEFRHVLARNLRLGIELQQTQLCDGGKIDQRYVFGNREQANKAIASDGFSTAWLP